jgi:hypothetical protein
MTMDIVEDRVVVNNTAARVAEEDVYPPNTLTGVGRRHEMSPQERWSKHVREHLFSRQEAEQQMIQQRRSKHVEEHLSR